MERNEAEQAARAYAPMVFHLAYARIGNEADAEDVMQEVFLRLVKTKTVFESDEHCRAWLLRVTVNCVSDVFRTPWRRHDLPLSETQAEPACESDGMGVLEAVLALPPKYRIPVHLYYYEELPIAEIAHAMGKSEPVVKTRLFRARAMLRKTLKGEEENA